MRFDRRNLELFRKEFIDAVRELSEKHKVTISLGNISYTDSKFHTKMEVVSQEALQAAGGDFLTPHLAKLKLDFRRNAPYYGMDFNYGKVIFKNGKNFILVGVKSRASKFPLVGMDLKTEKCYKLPETWAKEFTSARNVYNFETKRMESMA